MIKEILVLALLIYSAFLAIERFNQNQKYFVEGYREVQVETFEVKPNSPGPIESCTFDEDSCEE